MVHLSVHYLLKGALMTGRRFFTADPHFNHPGIVPMMGRVDGASALMGSIEEHDSKLISNINSMVDRDDELFILGDFAFDKPGRYRQQINCKHIKFVMGNHDRKTKTSNVFGQCHDIIRTEAFNKKKTDSVKLYLCHYPTMYWDQSHNGVGHLYGHCHSQREEYLDQLEPGRRAIDVGVDNAYRLFGEYRPFSDYEIYDYMSRRTGHDDVRFYKDFQLNMYKDLKSIQKQNKFSRKRRGKR
jgi:calcineurin-like phosphoesterase family protein